VAHGRDEQHLTDYGPTHEAFAALDEERQAVLTRELTALIAKHDRAEGRGCVVPGEYLEVVFETRRSH